ncbi:hypothetical protein CYY_006913 [Polysphondylium violaceum]|uniref:RRM domain-containing protein n=1 Tax=Polysphondylium violaceum TaxID=133409 RepID=A0A8J4PR68_9MYCE|nr:hypothetical protein CYY_006913 [Polysphondylium violaceum]
MEATKQIFVKGLPAETSNEDIENYFSEVGPIRRCFIITKKGSKVCNGMAYVWYALPEHAVLAVKEKNNKPFKNKIISVQVAKSKPADEKENNKNKKTANKDQKTQENNNEEQGDNTTTTTPTTTTTTEPSKPVLKKPIVEKKNEFVVIASNFVADKKIINHFLSLKDGTIQTVFPIPYSNGAIRIICESLENANKVLAKLAKGKEYNGKPVSFALESDHVKINELIIRNLSFTTNVQHLVDKFSPVGEVLLIKLPTKQGQSTNKGFGFVLYKQRDHAVKALSELNNTKINNRQVAIDWAVPQEQYKSMVNEKVESEKDQEMKDNKEEEEEEDNEEDNEEEDNEEGDDDEESDDDEDDDEDMDEDEDEDDDDEDMDDDAQDEKEKKRKEKEEWEKAKEKNIKEVGEMKTIFIRNLAFDTTQEELESKFEQFGSMVFCRLVLDKVTNKPTGKAFIKFNEKESAERAYHECQSVPLYDPTLEEKISKSNEKKKNSKKNQVNQLAALLQGGIMVGGRHLIVDYAVDHQKASDFKAKKIENSDKKNRHLLNIGKILQGSKEGNQLNEKDWKLRSEADKENNTKLKVNPNYYVSPTRLCFRNIPLHINDISLKHACMKALKEKNSKAKIVFSKVTVDKERISADGKPKSKGFGFVEFNTHEGALSALHVINNNTKIFYNQSYPKSKDHRPFVQFAVEDARAVKIQKEYHEKLRARQKTQKFYREQELKKNMNSNILNDAEAGQKLGRGQKQRLKKRLAREKLEKQGVNVEELHKEKEQQKVDKLRRQELASLPKNKVTQQSQEKEIKKLKETKKFVGSKRKDSDFDGKALSYRDSFNSTEDRPIKKKKWLKE